MLGQIETGRVWSAALEYSDLNAPGANYKVDPTLPILGTDPRFTSDQIVIGKGRLLSLKRDVTVSASDITSYEKGVSYIVPADGVTLAPLGYASTAMYKVWPSRMQGTMPQIYRNKMITLPYITATNGFMGSLQEGDPVTALYSTDPRKVGAVCKYIPLQTAIATGSAGNVTLWTIGQSNANFKPTVLAAFNSSGGMVDVASDAAVYSSTAWKVTSATVTKVIYTYGQAANMKAGEVYGMDSLTDTAGWLKWVESQFGSYELAALYFWTGNATALTDQQFYWTHIPNAMAIYATSGAIVPRRIDASKPIYVNVTTSCYLWNVTDGTWDVATADQLLPLAETSILGNAGKDYTMGKYYNIDPVNGVLYIYGIASDAAGTPIKGTAGTADATYLTIDYTPEDIQAERAYGIGQRGFTDGNPDHAGMPVWLTKDPVTLAAAIGIMRVAIH